MQGQIANQRADPSREKKLSSKAKGATSTKRKKYTKKRRIGSENRPVQSPTANLTSLFSRYPMATVPRPLSQRRVKSCSNHEKSTPMKKLFRKSKTDKAQILKKGRKDIKEKYLPKLNRDKITKKQSEPTALNLTNDDFTISLPRNDQEEVTKSNVLINNSKIFKRPDMFQALTLANVVVTVFSVIVLTSFAESNRILIKENALSNNAMKNLIEINSRHILKKCISTFDVLDSKVNNTEDAIWRLNGSLMNSRSRAFEELLFECKRGSMEVKAHHDHAYRAISKNVTMMFATLKEDMSKSNEHATLGLIDIEKNYNFVYDELLNLTDHLSQNELETIDLKENYKTLRHQTVQNQERTTTVENNIELIENKLQHDMTKFQQEFQKLSDKSESYILNVTDLNRVLTNMKSELIIVNNRVQMNENSNESVQEKILNCSKELKASNLLLDVITEKLEFQNKISRENQNETQKRIQNLHRQLESDKISCDIRIQELGDKLLDLTSDVYTESSSFSEKLDRISDKSELIEYELKQLKSDTMSDDIRIKDLTDKLVDLTGQFSTKMDGITKSSELTQNELKNINSNVSNAENKILFLEQNFTKRMQSTKDIMLDKYESQLDQINDATFKITHLEGTIKETQEDIEKTSSSLQKNMQKLKNKMKLAEISTAKMKELENSISFLSEYTDSDIGNLENQNLILSSKIENIASMLDRFESECKVSTQLLNLTMENLEKFKNSHQLINNKTDKIKSDVESILSLKQSSLQKLIDDVDFLNKSILQMNDSFVERRRRSQNIQKQTDKTKELIESFRSRIHDIESKLDELTESETKMKELQLVEEQRKQMEKWKKLERKYENMTKSTTFTQNANNPDDDANTQNENSPKIMNIIQKLVNKTDNLEKEILPHKESKIPLTDVKKMIEDCVSNMTEKIRSKDSEKDKNDIASQFNSITSHISALQNKSDHSFLEYDKLRQELTNEKHIIENLNKNVQDISELFRNNKNETASEVRNLAKDLEIQLEDIKDDQHQTRILLNDTLTSNEKAKSLSSLVESITNGMGKINATISKLSNEIKNKADHKSVENRVNQCENLARKSMNASKNSFSRIAARVEELEKARDTDTFVHQLNKSIDAVERKWEEKLDSTEGTMRNLSVNFQQLDKKTEFNKNDILKINKTINDVFGNLQDNELGFKREIESLGARIKQIRKRADDTAVETQKKIEKELHSSKADQNDFAFTIENELTKLAGKLRNTSNQFMSKFSSVEEVCTNNVQKLKEKLVKVQNITSDQEEMLSIVAEQLHSLNESSKDVSHLHALHDAYVESMETSKNNIKNIATLTKNLTSVEEKVESKLTTIAQQIFELETQQGLATDAAKEINRSFENVLKSMKELQSKIEFDKEEESNAIQEELHSLKYNMKKEIKDIFEDENIEMRVMTLEKVQASQFRILQAIETATANLKTQMDIIQNRIEDGII